MRQASWLFASGIALLWGASTFSCSDTVNRGDELTVTYSVQATVGVGGMENVASSSVASSSSAGGMGGAGGGMGGAGGTSSADASSSMASSSVMASSSSGPIPPAEQAIHGCFGSSALDLTKNPATITVSFANGNFSVPVTMDNNQTVTTPLPFPICLRIKTTQKLVFGGSSALGGPLLVGGVYDDGIGLYDKKSPIQPNCFTTNGFDPNSTACYNGGTWPCGMNTNNTTAANTCNANNDQKAFKFNLNFAEAGRYPFYNNSKKDTQQGVVYVVP